MGTCIYCGKPAGFLRKKHRECAEKRDRGWAEMVNLAKDAALGESPEGTLETLAGRLEEVARESFIPPEQVRDALIAGWEKAVNHFLEDGNLDAQEENRLAQFARHFDFTQEDLDRNGFYTRFVKGAVLRELMEGKVPSRFHPVGELPFNFQKSEALIWAFNDVAYYEEKTRRGYVGGSHGVSFRIAKGVYYRVGSFRGRPVEITEKVLVDRGILAVTTKHLYFQGAKKAFRVRWDKVVSFMPYSDGIGIQRDATTAKPQFFVTGDGWFTYNLLANIANLG
ncbi:hypothetical protein [Thermanaeromonas sp. C210]|uniref:hypothetical protein n=1 Tax=Thermanaeromonas sp. C210 TaxID=2731925 RepID=UPI00155C97F6|nr:hypothetical protein [Thermanaeromonas sp. C210]GFN23678.1 hypothetical protein TAMC210_19950 [Thermanaeromonas sp. C210]